MCKTARELAVSFARSALEKRAVDAAEPLPHFGPKEKELRNRLRARGRQVGDVRNEDKTQSIDQLTQVACLRVLASNALCEVLG